MLWVTALTLSPRDFPVREVRLDGWAVEVATEVLDSHKPEWGLARRLLDQQLWQIGRVVAEEPLAKLRQVTIWVSWNDPGTTCAAFHPSADYLREHKMNPAMAGGLEIGNVKNFLSWTHEQPWMVLHELAHAYHFRFLPQGFDNPDVKAGYDSAMKSKLYDMVLHWDGSMKKHYAETNPMEYFAESSEAYFGTNDFYPFTNAELKTYDPATFALMRKKWGDPAHRD